MEGADCPRKGCPCEKSKRFYVCVSVWACRQDQIARSCSIGQATVHRYLERAAAAGLSWPLPDDCDERRLQGTAVSDAAGLRPPSQPRPGLDFAESIGSCRLTNIVTLQLLWEEYRETQPGRLWLQPLLRTVSAMEPQSEMWFCGRTTTPARRRLSTGPATPSPSTTARTGEVTPASLFVAVLGASTYTFARAALSQDLANWIDCHVRAFEFFQGATKLIVPDNPRTGVDSRLPL